MQNKTLIIFLNFRRREIGERDFSELS